MFNTFAWRIMNCTSDPSKPAIFPMMAPLPLADFLTAHPMMLAIFPFTFFALMMPTMVAVMIPIPFVRYGFRVGDDEGKNAECGQKQLFHNAHFDGAKPKVFKHFDRTDRF